MYLLCLSIFTDSNFWPFQSGLVAATRDPFSSFMLADNDDLTELSGPVSLALTVIQNCCCCFVVVAGFPS